MKLARVKLEVIRALLSYYELRDLIASSFAPGTPTDVVRCSEVAALVAEKTGAELSPQFRRRVRHAAGIGGWRRVVKRGNVAWYRGMVKR